MRSTGFQDPAHRRPAYRASTSSAEDFVELRSSLTLSRIAAPHPRQEAGEVEVGRQTMAGGSMALSEL